MLKKRIEFDELWQCELVFRSKYRADSQALETLLRRFKALVKSIASERYATGHLDAGTFEDVFAFGQLGLIEAIMRYDGRAPLANYAYSWIFKRCQEFVRFSRNVVLQPESDGRKATATIPNTGLNPFENPYSIDYKPKPSRHVSYNTPIDDDGGRSPEDRFHAGSIDVEHHIDGANHFEIEELQLAASVAAEAHAIEVETLALTLDARTLALLPRELQVIRARFPWAIDVKNTPNREEELGEYQPGHQRCFPKEHTLQTIGDALTPPVTGEWVRRIEQRALEKMRASKVAAVCSKEMLWGPQPYWNTAALEPVVTNWRASELPTAREPDHLIDKLAETMVLRQRKKKSWVVRCCLNGILFNLLCEEEIRKGRLLPTRERKKYLNSKESKDDRKLHKIKLQDARGIPGGKSKPFQVEGSIGWKHLTPGQRVKAECTTIRHFEPRSAVNCASGVFWLNGRERRPGTIPTSEGRAPYPKHHLQPTYHDRLKAYETGLKPGDPDFNLNSMSS